MKVWALVSISILQVNLDWEMSLLTSSVSHTGNARAFSSSAEFSGEYSWPVCFSRVLQQLEQSHWLDHCTKSLFVEFVVFNANVNLFCVVTLILESNNVGMKASSLFPLCDLGITEGPISFILFH